MADVILVDFYNYTVKPAWQGGKPGTLTLTKGEPLDGLKESILGYDREVARGKSLNAIGPEEILAERLSVVASAPPPIPVERLANATTEELAQIQADAQEAVLRRSVQMGQMPSNVYTDEQIGKMSAEELTAIAGQFPSEIPRILQIEQARGKSARKTVLALDPDYRP